MVYFFDYQRQFFGITLSRLNDFKRIAKPNIEAMRVVITYAVFISLLSLAVPVSVQTLINFISFGTLLQPVVVLSIILLIILTMAASVRVAQAIIIETIQQNIFARLAMGITSVLPKIHSKKLSTDRMATLVNFFFEIQTIQKTIAVLLVTVVQILVLSLFSMVLIAFYHPLLLLYDVILIIAVSMAIYWPWRTALHFALKQCDAKHRVAEWLEEIVANIILFKCQNNIQNALKTADKKTRAYLRARQALFKNILKHIVSLNAIYVLANTILLGVGGYLVIRQQLSLGQLVAAELLINTMLYDILRFSSYLQDIYNLLVSSTKVNQLLDLHIEQSRHPILANPESYENDINIVIKNLYLLHDGQRVNQEAICLNANTSQPLSILCTKNKAASLILDTTIGLKDEYEGLIKINEIPLQDFNIRALRQNSLVLRRLDLFSGSIAENLQMGSKNITSKEIYSALNQFNLGGVVSQLPRGLETTIQELSTIVIEADLYKICWLRAILHTPRLLLIDYFLDHFFNEELETAFDFINNYPGTIIITTRRSDIHDHFDHRMIL